MRANIDRCITGEYLINIGFNSSSIIISYCRSDARYTVGNAYRLRLNFYIYAADVAMQNYGCASESGACKCIVSYACA